MRVGYCRVLLGLRGCLADLGGLRLSRRVGGEVFSGRPRVILRPGNLCFRLGLRLCLGYGGDRGVRGGGVQGGGWFRKLSWCLCLGLRQGTGGDGTQGERQREEQGTGLPKPLLLMANVHASLLSSVRIVCDGCVSPQVWRREIRREMRAIRNYIIWHVRVVPSRGTYLRRAAGIVTLAEKYGRLGGSNRPKSAEPPGCRGFSPVRPP